MIQYTDTRGLSSRSYSFTEAVLTGLAPDGGLFVPEHLPHFSLEELQAMQSLPYHAVAARIFKAFQPNIADEAIDALCAQAYGQQFDDERIAPVHSLDNHTHVLELWHGPTSAFKDIALQALPLFFEEGINASSADGTGAGCAGGAGSGISAGGAGIGVSAGGAWIAAGSAGGNIDTSASAQTHSQSTSPHSQSSAQTGSKRLILVATSGDTGSAALCGFSHARNTSMAVLYPHQHVSEMQHAQMQAHASNQARIFAVRGNFDDCQRAVKELFGNQEWNRALQSHYNTYLSSANSINWGRLLPQIVYYVSAYHQLREQGVLQECGCFDVCVPTGNFGNILAGYYAKQIGVPIRLLICASNENNVLAQFMATGSYSLEKRPLVSTPSPSMDILVSSNLERALFELTQRNARLVRAWMEALKTKQAFKIDRTTFNALRDTFAGDWVSNDDCLRTMKHIFETYRYAMDPHSAVAFEVAQRLGDSSTPMLIVSTASWAKFSASMYRALHNIANDQPLPSAIAQCSSFQLNALLAEKFRLSVPPALTQERLATTHAAVQLDRNTADIQAALEQFQRELACGK